MGSRVLCTGLPSIRLISASTSNLPARRVSCTTVVSDGLTLRLKRVLSSNREMVYGALTDQAQLAEQHGLDERNGEAALRDERGHIESIEKRT